MSRTNPLVRARQLLRKGQADKALQITTRALKKRGARAPLWHLHGVALLALDRREEAIEALEAALVSQPDLRSARLRLGVVLATAEPMRAIEYLVPVLEQQSSAEGWYAAGQAFRTLGHAADAQRCYKNALTADPEYTRAHLQLGQMLGNQGVTDRARVHFQAVQNQRPDDPAGSLKLGYLHLQTGELDRAERNFKRALAVLPGHPAALAGLGLVLDRSRRQDEAHALLEPHIHGDIPPMLAFAFANICRRRPDPERAISCVQRTLATGVNAHDENLLGHALGDLLDKSGRYEQAFIAYKRANDARRSRWDGERHREAVSHLIGAPPIPTDSGSEDDRPVLIVGMPRSGTSLVEQILATHPDVAAGGERSDWNELATAAKQLSGQSRCWYQDPTAIHTELLQRLATDAQQKWSAAGLSGKRITDKMPHNFLHLALIARVFPRARVIHCVRDPIDTGWSCYRQLFKTGLDWTTTQQGIGDWTLAYQEAMAHYSATSPLPILEVRYSDMVHDHEAMVRKIIHFAELDWDERVLSFHSNRRAMATASWAQVQSKVYSTSVGRSRPYHPWLGEMRERILGESELRATG